MTAAFVAVVMLALVSNVVIVFLFLRQQQPLVRGVVAKNTAELVRSEVTSNFTSRRPTPDDDDEPRPRVMGL